LQGGLPTDRLNAEWWLRSKRVCALLNGGALPPIHTLKTIFVPAAIYDWKKSDAERHKAQAVQLENRNALLAAFSEGLSILGYERDADGNGTFQLGHWNENKNAHESEPRP
jgi:predicted GNAT superfamily acetyltransferase